MSAAPPRKRPVAVIILALINFLEAVTLLLFGGVLGLWFWLATEEVGVGLEMPPGTVQLLSWLLRLMDFGGLLLPLAAILVPALILTVVGIGLWRLRNWARVGNIYLTAAKLALLLVGSVVTLAATPALFLGLEALQALVYAWIIWYLLQPSVKQVFRAN